MKTVSILCRGKSLKYINDISPADQCILVNAFHYELQDNDIHTYVSACPAVTHVVSLGALFQQMISDKVYERYNFDKIVLPYVKEETPRIPSYMYNINGPNGTLPITSLSDINKKDMISHPRYAFTSPTCGMDAVVYSVNELMPDIINIIGMDFYSNTGYFTNSSGKAKNDMPDELAVRRGEPTDKMQSFLMKMIETNPNIEFNLHTMCNIDFSYNNLKVKHYE